MKTSFRLLLLTVLMVAMVGAAQPASAQEPPIRISFPRGATGARIMGSAYGYQTVTYVLYLLRGQEVSVSLFDAYNTFAPTGLSLGIMDARGNVLLSTAYRQAVWTGTLPRTGNYYVQVSNSQASGANFRLEISVPAQIRFARGATSATLTGFARTYEPVQYFFYARANQYITLVVTSPFDNVRLTLVGADGIPLIRAAVMPTNTATAILPATQRYTLIVEQMSGAVGTDYTLYISIVG